LGFVLTEKNVHTFSFHPEILGSYLFGSTLASIRSLLPFVLCLNGHSISTVELFLSSLESALPFLFFFESGEWKNGVVLVAKQRTQCCHAASLNGTLTVETWILTSHLHTWKVHGDWPWAAVLLSRLARV
jgi:hypothetical protein